MIGRQSAQNGIIAHLDMTGEGGAVGHDDMIADDTVMGNMGICHEQIVAADNGLPGAVAGAAMHGDRLADGVAVTDLQGRFLSLELEILRRCAYRRELVDPVLFPDFGPIANDHVRRNDRPVTYRRAFTNDRIRADLDVFPDFGTRMNDCRLVNHHFFSRAVKVAFSSASATRVEPTKALPANV